MNEDRKIKVLQVVGAMNRGGAETWLMGVLENIDRQRFQINFLVHTLNEGTFDREILAKGAQVIPCMHPHQPIRYARSFFKLIRETGPYHVIHSHVEHFTGYILALSRLSGIPVRIAHSHSDSLIKQKSGSLSRKIYYWLMKRLLNWGATGCLAASRDAARSLYGTGRSYKDQVKVLYCGIDLHGFRNAGSPEVTRRQLNIDDEDWVLGHVGSFREVKNHRFLVDIAAEINKLDKTMHLLLVGDGPLRAGIQENLKNRGLADRVTLTGVRSDVPSLMKSAMDAFVFPSITEGLGNACLEAQAAGLPVVMSDTIPQEAVVVPELVKRMSLDEPALDWAKAILSMRKYRTDGLGAISKIEQSAFNLENSTRALEEIYASV